MVSRILDEFQVEVSFFFPEKLNTTRFSARGIADWF